MAALTSRSWVLPHGQSHARTSSAILSLMRPQSEHVRVDGKNRSTRAKVRPYFAALYSNMLVKLARSSAGAIANAIDYERERRIARALTLGFVPESLPEVPGYETGLLYAPAANEPTGGDVYGAWPVGRDSVAVLVGDVAGKGVETAAQAAFLQAERCDEAQGFLYAKPLPANEFEEFLVAAQIRSVARQEKTSAA